eukprot:2775007-Rhodomonas_salina.1
MEYRVKHSIDLQARYAITTGADFVYGATRPKRYVVRYALRQSQYRAGISLRASYAMSGTDIVYAVVVLRNSYALSGTDIAYGAIILRAV